MSNSIKYWKGEEELNRDTKFLAARKNEFAEPLPLDDVLSEDGVELNSNRRDFLKFFGFSVTAVALAACYRAPIRKAVPYLVKPENVTPGVANYYSSQCGACSVGCGIEVKVREGRPIKVDGSPRSPISQGSLCAQGQGSIASLYDSERLANPLKNGAEMADWAAIDADITKRLAAIAAAGGRIALVSSSIHSPSTLKAIEDFKVKYTTTEHVTYDAISYSGILSANLADFGASVVPTYKFENAEVIVSFGADFLGTWISPVEFTKGWSKGRVPSKDKNMSLHIQFESNMSLTGTNADYRFPVAASKTGLYLASLYNYIANKAGVKQIAVAQSAEAAGNAIAKAGDALINAKGRSLVICGSNSTNDQQITNAINMLLENYGKTIDMANHSNQFKGIDKDTDKVMNDLKAGSIAAVIFYGVNPVYNGGKTWEDGIKKAKLSVSFSSSKDETASLCEYVCPDNHYLESWNDGEPRKGVFQFTQPTISPVFNTRQAQVSLITWAGTLPALEKDPFADKGILSQKHATSPFYSYIKQNWSTRLTGDLDTAFNKCLHDGVWTANGAPVAPAAKTEGNVENATAPAAVVTAAIVSVIPSYAGNVDALASGVQTKSSGLEMLLYANVSIGDGSQANNPWLQELPDPVSKVTWDNYVAIPKSFAAANNIKEGNTVNVKAGNITLNSVPVLIQPGQANGTVSLALGYGRTAAGKVGGSKEAEFDAVGVNAYPLISMVNGNRSYVVSGVEITKADEEYSLAQTQTHHSIEGRDLVREATFADWKKKANAGNDKDHPHVYTIWEKRDYLKDGAPGHRWAMAIDLNACTGCSACAVSCSLENNVPVVGRDEVRLRREMHWIRIDRYYSFTNTAKKEFDGNYVTKEKEIKAIDKAEGEKGEYEHWENVKVVHQPMMCQHCAQAPCETVCPVLATTHSSEGLNQMTYNRCIGTKYCGNNCPYKVRRYNWFRYNDNDHFDFHYNNPLGKMVINPDVTVRTRGVMEKCSFCVQRIQEGKLKAKRDGLDKNEVKVETACQRACPSNAIVFGDLQNPESEISKLYKNERGFSVLEELNVQSSVAYLTKIRNTETV